MKIDMTELFWTIRRNIHETWYYCKCAILPWRRYNHIHIKTLPPTWVDRDTVLAHAIFQILEDFVKKECLPGIIDWDATEEHRHARQTMDELLDWWHNTYLPFDPFEADKIQIRFHEDGSIKKATNEEKEYIESVLMQEFEMEQELRKKINLLLDIRKFLWT